MVQNKHVRYNLLFTTGLWLEEKIIELIHIFNSRKHRIHPTFDEFPGFLIS